MWMPKRTASRAQRTPSVHSVDSLVLPQVGTPSMVHDHDRVTDSAHAVSVPAIWQSNQQHTRPFTRKTERERAAKPARSYSNSDYKTQWEIATDDDATSRSSTLDGEEEYMEHLERKEESTTIATSNIPLDEPQSPAPAAHVPGPLESQLAALMSKLIYLEHANPVVSVTPEEYANAQTRLQTLEEEKKDWWKRHEAIWALRDEDVENNIKIRGMLAKTRRELDTMRMLRDEDLTNVQLVRTKLAEKTRELERLQGHTGRASPSRGRPGSFFERRDTTDLFAAAKTAALEQRALELEKRNDDLVAQVGALKGGTSIDDLNRLTAHQAWKDTVADLEGRLKAKDAEIIRLRDGDTFAGVNMNWGRFENLLEEHANYREAVGGRLQALRSEKEALLKDVHRKEAEVQALEMKILAVQRK